MSFSKQLGLLLLLCEIIQLCSSISFHLDADTRKCVREEVHADVLVVGEYALQEVHGQKTNIEVSATNKFYCKLMIQTLGG